MHNLFELFKINRLIQLTIKKIKYIKANLQKYYEN